MKKFLRETMLFCLLIITIVISLLNSPKSILDEPAKVWAVISL